MAFFGGGPFVLLPLFLLALSLELELELLEFELESSLSTAICVLLSFSSLDFRELRLLFGEDPLGLFDDLLSVSDSELLSGENMLFFLCEFVSDFDAFCVTFGAGLGVLAPGGCLFCACFPLTNTAAADLPLVDVRLRGGKVLGLTTLGVSSSLDEDTLSFEGRRFGSSFFFGSSGLTGDFGAVWAVAPGGVSELEESESELLEPVPELDEELPLLLESDVDPELLSVLLLLT